MMWALIIFYFLAMLLILLYSIVQFSLVISYRKSSKKTKKEVKILNLEKDPVPIVTLQLPLFNEKYVVERLIDAVSKIQYPKDKLEVQILDDSTDETSEIITKKLRSMGDATSHFIHIQRPERIGFKAGALNYGMEIARGELFAVFDADFIPESDFLLRTVAYFRDEKVGVIQTRWGHINRDYSLLTKIQAFALDAHFTVEQAGRNSKEYFINFNGTAGIWRGSCITDAGGWEFDTITEDLDLSYRAQFRNWKFIYLEDVVSPAELPVVMSAVKTQQFRWNKGAAQNFRKLHKQLMNEKMPISKRIHAFAHLLNSSIFIIVFIIGILSIPVLYIKIRNIEVSYVIDAAVIFFISMVILMIFYWHSFNPGGISLIRRLLMFTGGFLAFLVTSMGLALHNTIAVIEGHIGIESSFVRTPKFNIKSKTDSWKGNIYIIKNIGFVTALEGLLTLYFMAGFTYAIIEEEYGFAPFILMLTLGYGFVFLKSIKQT